MVELKVKHYELINIKDAAMMEFILTQRLRSAGFDLSKEITRHEDMMNQVIIYQQKENDWLWQE